MLAFPRWTLMRSAAFKRWRRIEAPPFVGSKTVEKELQRQQKTHFWDEGRETFSYQVETAPETSRQGRQISKWGAWFLRSDQTISIEQGIHFLGSGRLDYAINSQFLNPMISYDMLKVRFGPLVPGWNLGLEPVIGEPAQRGTILDGPTDYSDLRNLFYFWKLYPLKKRMLRLIWTHK